MKILGTILIAVPLLFVLGSQFCQMVSESGWKVAVLVEVLGFAALGMLILGVYLVCQ